jgi:retron-type reverse transcriptase
MAMVLILEPIFEADFQECSYGFRRGRSAHQALEAIRQGLKAGLTAIYDADLKGYYDSIPQDKLLACVRMRVADRSVLGLIRMWLEAPIREEKRCLKNRAMHVTPPTTTGSGCRRRSTPRWGRKWSHVHRPIEK